MGTAGTKNEKSVLSLTSILSRACTKWPSANQKRRKVPCDANISSPIPSFPTCHRKTFSNYEYKLREIRCGLAAPEHTTVTPPMSRFTACAFLALLAIAASPAVAMELNDLLGGLNGGVRQ